MTVFTEAHQPTAFKRLSSRNFERQHGFVKDLTELMIAEPSSIKLTASIIKSINAVIVAGLTDSPGSFRSEPVHINGSDHMPSDADDVGLEIGKLCVFANKEWDHHDPFELSAYILWRLTQIHPFEDGNGRTANVVAYYIICRKVGYWLPGKAPFPLYWREQQDEQYYKALKAADASPRKGPAATKNLAELIARAVTHQLESADY